MKAGKEKSIFRRHPWIFSGAVQSIDRNPENGDVVRVCDSRGQYLATGHFQNDSIMVKVLDFEDNAINRDFWHKHLASAVEYRRKMGFFDNQETNVFRLVNGEGDNMPGLIADYYNSVVVLQAHSEGMHRNFGTFAEILQNALGEQLVSVFDKSSSTLPSGDSKDGYIFGQKPEEWEVKEDGNRLIINFFEGQKTGFFIDQRENRHLLRTLSQGKRVLNTFGYTGGFSLSALRGGAQFVETVDISKKAIELCNRNVALNFDNAPHQGTAADVLQYLDKIDDSFDIIILDPPAFAKNHRNLQQGLKGYKNINQRAMEKIKKGGLLFTFSCSQAVSRDDFQTMVFTSAANARRNVRIVKQLPHAIDHPVSIFHPEGEYLKGLLLYVE